MAGLCIYISIHFPSAQNWTFAVLSSNYCVSRGLFVYITSFCYLEVSNELISILVDTALRSKILCCIVCWNCLVLSLVNCYYIHTEEIATVSAVNVIIYLFFIFVIIFWFVGNLNGQYITNLTILLRNDLANNFLVSFLVDHTVSYFYI
jgi:hypothetical protein